MALQGRQESPGPRIQQAEVPGETDPRLRALAFGLEFTKRAFQARTLEDLYFLLTNDIRSVLEFDRSFLAVHLGPASEVVAVGNVPLPDESTKFHQAATDLAESLRGVGKAVVLANTSEPQPTLEGVPQEASSALQQYMSFSRCSFLISVPLNRDSNTIGHVVLEYFERKIPDQANIITVLNIAPLLSAALAEKWLIHKKPALARVLRPSSGSRTRARRVLGILKWTAIAAVILGVVFFLVPVDLDVGGEAEIAPKIRFVAFCKIDGIIDKVLVAEGDRVARDAVLATLDPKEIDFQIDSTERQIEIFTNEMAFLLRTAAQENTAKLAERELVALKRKGAEAELAHLKWKRQFLDIKSPVDGTVVTRDVESLAGKKMRGGEPFCELVARHDLSVEVYVPEDRVTRVEKGQHLTVYFDSDPSLGYELRVAEVAPRARAVPRLGNVFRVQAPFPDAPPSMMVGMRGIGRVYTGQANIYFVVRERLVRLWNRLMLHF